jgi:hypothetical protein
MLAIAVSSACRIDWIRACSVGGAEGGLCMCGIQKTANNCGRPKNVEKSRRPKQAVEMPVCGKHGKNDKTVFSTPPTYIPQLEEAK